MPPQTLSGQPAVPTAAMPVIFEPVILPCHENGPRKYEFLFLYQIILTQLGVENGEVETHLTRHAANRSLSGYNHHYHD
jgi:hypothetical protein